jgi:hypothetical protein
MGHRIRSSLAPQHTGDRHAFAANDCVCSLACDNFGTVCILIYAHGSSARRKVLLLIYTFSPPVFFGVCSFEFALLRVCLTHSLHTYIRAALAHMSQPSASFQNPSPCHPNSLSVSHYAFYRETYNRGAVCSLFNNLLSSCCSSLFSWKLSAPLVLMQKAAPAAAIT